MTVALNLAPQRVAQPIRVLVVDDSAYVRVALSRYLRTAPDMHVVGTAADGLEALRLMPELRPNVVLLDVEMPNLDGLATLKEIMARFPCPVVMVSGLTTLGAQTTVRALLAGAVDFIEKPGLPTHLDLMLDELLAKVRLAAQASPPPIAFAPLPREKASQLGGRLAAVARMEAQRVVVIGASTGGPRALSQLLARLPADLPAALLIVQHMPPGFTRPLAERLNSLTQLEVREAHLGMELKPGVALIAPAGYHLTVAVGHQVVLNQNPTVHGVRPAVDITLAAVAQHFGARALGVILTGMGIDGTRGAQLVRQAGGQVLAQAEAGCVVWGMPRSVVEAGAADAVVPLADMASAIVELVHGRAIKR